MIQDYVKQCVQIQGPETFFPQMLDELQEVHDAALASMQGGTWRPSDEKIADPLKMVGSAEPGRPQCMSWCGRKCFASSRNSLGSSLGAATSFQAHPSGNPS